MARIQLKRGNYANLPSTGLLAGEPLVSVDRANLHVATDATTKVPITPAVAELSTLASIENSDLLIIHDTSELATNQMEKKITFTAFKTALNIPTGSTDELVGAASGYTAKYLGGTDGSDGALQAGDGSITLALNSGNNALDISVATVDGGTF